PMERRVLADAGGVRHLVPVCAVRVVGVVLRVEQLVLGVVAVGLVRVVLPVVGLVGAGGGAGPQAGGDGAGGAERVKSPGLRPSVQGGGGSYDGGRCCPFRRRRPAAIQRSACLIGDIDQKRPSVYAPIMRVPRPAVALLCLLPTACNQDATAP